ARAPAAAAARRPRAGRRARRALRAGGVHRARSRGADLGRRRPRGAGGERAAARSGRRRAAGVVAVTRAIDQLVAGPHTRQAVDAFLAGKSFPIVEGSAITIVYRGDAEAVHLKHWVFG